MRHSCAVIGLGNIGFQYRFKFAGDSKTKTWSHVDAYLKSDRTDLVAAVEIDNEMHVIHK